MNHSLSDIIILKQQACQKSRGGRWERVRGKEAASSVTFCQWLSMECQSWDVESKCTWLLLHIVNIEHTGKDVLWGSSLLMEAIP